MRKYLLCLFLTGLFMSLVCLQVFALEAAFNADNAGNGFVTVTLTGFGEKRVMIQVEKGEEVCRYLLARASANIPLQMGAGDYTIRVLEDVDGSSFMVVVSESVSVDSIDETSMFTTSIPNMDYAASEVAVPLLRSYAEGKETNGQIDAIYTDVIEVMDYDYEKAITLANASFYVPVIDTAYEAQKGICYDYAAIFGGTLRSLGIPTKLVTGYVPEIPGVFHAWNEILIDGEWVAVDSTYDAQALRAGADFNMAKDKTKTQIVRIY